jgi:hypothetical protein
MFVLFCFCLVEAFHRTEKRSLLFVTEQFISFQGSPMEFLQTRANSIVPRTRRDSRFESDEVTSPTIWSAKRNKDLVHSPGREGGGTAKELKADLWKNQGQVAINQAVFLDACRAEERVRSLSILRLHCTKFLTRSTRTNPMMMQHFHK